ncbi:MAG: HD domain-containing protein [Thermodesulfobacteriota bacterium]
MAKVFVGDIKEGDRVNAAFLVKGKTRAETRYGKPYLTLQLMDRTGEVTGRVWERAQELSARFENGDLIAVKGTAEIYQQEIQLNISDLERCEDEGISWADFLPSAPREPEEMLNELRQLFEPVQRPALVKLVHALFADKEIISGFCQVPAAKRRHHVYLGGLLEHTLSVVKLAARVAEHYPEVDRDLLLVGALLHDLGKIKELTYARGFDYTDEGRLLGHIILGVELVEDKINEIEGFPAELCLLLKHMLLSHHGLYEYQSPKKPKTLEALVLHHIEDMDGKVNWTRQILTKAKREGKRWTSFDRLTDRFFYAGAPSEEGDEG